MGSFFSQEEEKEVAPYIQGINPTTLAALILDAINMDGFDEEEGKIGISFDSGASNPEDKNSITFWNEEEITTLPKNVFLEIMKMTGLNIVKIFEDSYDLEHSKELDESVTILRDALDYLDEYLATLDCEENVEDYKNRLDDEESEEFESEESDQSVESDESDQLEDSDQSEDLDQPESMPSVSVVSASKPPVVEPTVMEAVDDAQDVEVAKESCSADEPDTESAPPSAEYLAQRRGSRGMVGVLDRLPELRRRLGDPGSPEAEPQSFSPKHNTALDKVKKKVKLLSAFHVKRDEVSPEISPEQEGLRSLLKSPETPPVTPVICRKKLSMRSKSLSLEVKDKHPHIIHHRSTGSLPDKLSSLELLQQMGKNSPLNSPTLSVLSLPDSMDDNAFADSPTGSCPSSPMDPDNTPTSPATNSSICTTPRGNGETLPDTGGNSPTPSLSSPPSSTSPEGMKASNFPSPAEDNKPFLRTGSLDTIPRKRKQGIKPLKLAQLAWGNSLELNFPTQAESVDIPDSPTTNVVDRTVSSLPGSIDPSSP